MNELEIVNPIDVGQVPGWMATLATTFLRDPSSELAGHAAANRQRTWIPERTWGVQEHGRWVATLATHPRIITVPAADGDTRDLTADALTNVTVNATHRRHGLLSRMLGQSLAAAHDRGDALSILVPAEWPIYGRFGYAPGTQYANYTYHCRAASARVRPAGAGAVRQVDVAEFRSVASKVHDQARRQRVGQVDRAGLWWPRELGLDGMISARAGVTPNRFIHEGPDGVDGLLCWHASRDFDIDGSLGAVEVTDLVAVNDEAYRNLWAYLGSIDVISKIRLAGRPVDEAARWLMPDGRALRQDYCGDHVWLRLLDVPTALAARDYALPGHVVFDVIDDAVGGYGAGRVLLEVDRSGVSCSLTATSADVRLTQRALASIYLGGHRLRQVSVAGGVEELTAGAISRVDSMFATALPPWNATGF